MRIMQVGVLVLSGIFFVSPFVRGEGDLSFEKAIELAKKNAPALKKQIHGYEAQHARTVASWLDAGPRGNITYNFLRYQAPQFTAIGGGPPLEIRPQNIQTATATLTQPITPLYAIYKNAKLEGLKKEVQQQTVDITDAEIGFATAELYVRAQQFWALMELSQARIRSGEAQQKEGEALLRAEKIDEGDAAKLGLALSEAKSQAATVKAQWEILTAGLRQAVGYEDGVSLSLPPLKPVARVEVPEPKKAIEQALGTRLQLQQARKGIEIAEIGTLFAGASILPQMNVFARWNQSYGAVPFGQEKFTKAYGVSVSWDLWDNGSRIFSIREAGEKAMQAQYDVEELEKQIRLQVIEACAHLQAFAEKLALAEGSVTQAKKSYEIEQSRFRAGSNRISDLVLAEGAEAMAQSNRVSTQADIYAQRFALQKAQGLLVPTL